MCCPAGVVKKALRGDDLGTPLAKKGFSGDGGKGRFAKGPAKAQVTDGLFSAEAIIHFAIVTAGALFGYPSSLPRPFLASASPNPSPRSHYLALWAIFALGGTNPTQLAGMLFNHRSPSQPHNRMFWPRLPLLGARTPFCAKPRPGSCGAGINEPCGFHQPLLANRNP